MNQIDEPDCGGHPQAESQRDPNPWLLVPDPERTGGDAGTRGGEAGSSCTVYGMPKAAMRLGPVAEELETDDLAERLLGHLDSARAAPGATR